jgi:hypothetical protein
VPDAVDVQSAFLPFCSGPDVNLIKAVRHFLAAMALRSALLNSKTASFASFMSPLGFRQRSFADSRQHFATRCNSLHQRTSAGHSAAFGGPAPGAWSGVCSIDE